MTNYRIVEVPEYEGEPTYTIQKNFYEMVADYVNPVSCGWVIIPSYKIVDNWIDIKTGLKTADEARDTIKRLEFNANRQVRVVE